MGNINDILKHLRSNNQRQIKSSNYTHKMEFSMFKVKESVDSR